MSADGAERRPAENAAPKLRGKPFVKGRSGNPAGKARGTKNRTTRVVEALIAGSAERITQAAIDKACGGSPDVIRALLDRLAPVRRDRPVEFELPPIKTSADLEVALDAVAGQVADGTLTPGEGQQICTLIETRRRTRELVDLEARIAALEAFAKTESTDGA